MVSGMNVVYKDFGFNPNPSGVLNDWKPYTGCISTCYCDTCKIAYWNGVCLCITARWHNCEKCNNPYSLEPMIGIEYTSEYKG